MRRRRVSPEFSTLCSTCGRASIAPEKLLRVVDPGVLPRRPERQLIGQVRYNMLFRWFIGLAMDAAVRDVTVFTKNRDRLRKGVRLPNLLVASCGRPETGRRRPSRRQRSQPRPNRAERKPKQAVPSANFRSRGWHAPNFRASPKLPENLPDRLLPSRRG
jgi:hypothetical protein